MQINLAKPRFCAALCNPVTCREGLSTETDPSGRHYNNRPLRTKILRVMRLITFLMLVGALHISAKGVSQKITFTGKNVKLEKIFTDVEKQTGYVFFYDNSLLRNAAASITASNMPLADFMQQVLKDQPLTFSIKNQTIFISEKPVTATLIEKMFEGPQHIAGTVVDERGTPVQDASVSLKPGYARTTTNDKGIFLLRDVPVGEYELDISFLGYETIKQKIKVDGKNTVSLNTLILKKTTTTLDGVAVLSNGYQTLSPERTTGSYTLLGKEMLNRSVSTNILDRLNGITPGLIFNKNNTTGSNPSNISIRGRSTIFANPNPLIVIDNFPYDGDINNINPNDVESITVLRDAAAASIWGAFSGNGVIVITTTKGKYNQEPRLSFNSNVTVGDKPDLFYNSRMSIPDYIELEKFLFGKGFYNGRLNTNRSGVSEAVELLNSAAKGQITQAQLDEALEQLGKQDVRRDINRYAYRKSVNQQYALHLTGGGINNQYAFMAGYDKNLSNIVNDKYARITLNNNNTWRLLQQKLEIKTGISFTHSTMNNNTGAATPATSPYFSYKDENGNAAASSYSREYYRPGYLDTTGMGKLLDWHYRPLDELNLADNVTKSLDYRINVSLKYRIIKGLDATVFYQYNNSGSEQKALYSQATFFTRDLINRYTQLNYATGAVTRAIPLGSILDTRNSDYSGHHARGQLLYHTSWNNLHEITALAGAEIKDASGAITTTRLYGYNKETLSNSPVNYLGTFPMYYAAQDQRAIPNNNFNYGNYDRFIAYYGNAAYTYKGRYTLSASARKDASNLFGVNSNQRGVPLWSAGLAWDISQEEFYKISWLPYLKLRATRGYNGNIDKSVYAYITSVISGNNLYGSLSGSITNPPNPDLRWEKIHMLNFGADFSALHGRISGSLEFYTKKGLDLLGYSPLAPSTGITEYKGNTADIKGRGADIELTSKNTTGAFKWNTTLQFSYYKDELVKYRIKQLSIGYYINTEMFNPIEGNPLFSLYSYKWAGLDPLTGDPQGYLDGHVSKDYISMAITPDFDNLQYNGPLNPTVFGSFMNSFSWKELSFSFNVLYKFGHYFRRPTVDYYDIVNYGFGFSHADYAKRWQQPGDEAHTDIPSFKYPLSSVRESFYRASSAVVERGDHIRLQDIRLGYDLPAIPALKNRIRKINVYLYANNIGIIWRANNKGIDPDYVLGMPPARTVAAGLKIDL